MSSALGKVLLWAKRKIFRYMVRTDSEKLPLFDAQSNKKVRLYGLIYDMCVNDFASNISPSKNNFSFSRFVFSITDNRLSIELTLLIKFT